MARRRFSWGFMAPPGWMEPHRTRHWASVQSGQRVRPSGPDEAGSGYRGLNHADPFGLFPCLVPPISAACVYVAGSAAGGLAWIGSKLIDKALRDDPVVFLRGFSAQGWLQSDGADDGDERNPAQDKRLSPREIRRLQRGGEDPEEIK